MTEVVGSLRGINDGWRDSPRRPTKHTAAEYIEQARQWRVEQALDPV